MNKKTFKILLGCMILVAVLFPFAVYAGGIAMYEVSPSQTALASAGWAARADDASTLFANPAGMTRLKKSEFLAGIQPLYTDLNFSPDARTTHSGSGNNSRNWLPTGDMYYVHSISPDLKAGIGILGYFGLSLDYGDNWVGRYYVKSATLQGMTIQPSIAYKLTDRISIGGGLNAMYGTLKDKTAINNIGAGDLRPDGQLKIEDNEWGYGANLGILYEVNKGTRIGFNYLSEVKLDFKDTPQFSGLGPVLTDVLARRSPSLDLTMRVPQMVMLSVFHELNNQWAIMGDVGWQDWSRFGKVDVQVTSTARDSSLTTDLHYQDTWHFALGAQYRPCPPWLFMFGAAYDSSSVKSGDMSVVLPMGETYRFGSGAEYKWNEHLSLGLSGEVAWLDTLKADQERGPLTGRVAGEYKNAAIYAIHTGLRYQF